MMLRSFLNASDGTCVLFINCGTESSRVGYRSSNLLQPGLKHGDGFGDAQLKSAPFGKKYT